jgi:hypothetical protein
MRLHLRLRLHMRLRLRLRLGLHLVSKLEQRLRNFYLGTFEGTMHSV